MAYSVFSNSPVDGAIAWEGLNIQYGGETNAIADGYTNTRYAYWSPAYPNNLIVTNDFPVLGPDDCLVFVNKNGVVITIPTASVVDGDVIIPGTILTNALAANVITADKLAVGAITADALAAGAIGTEALAAGAVQADNIAAGAITANAISANAIGAGAIAAGAILSDAIVAGAITTGHIASAAVTANQIAANAITADKIKAGEVTATKIAAGAITTNHLAPQFGNQLVIGDNAAIKAVTDALGSEAERAQTVEGEIKLFTDKATAFFVFDLTQGLMSIGKAGSPFTSEFSTTKLSFKQSGAEIAYISNSKLYISVAEIMDVLTVGNATDGYVDIDTKDGGMRASWRAS